MDYRLAGEIGVAMPPSRVWPLLLDPEFIGDCSEGIDTIAAVNDTHFHVTTEVKVGPFTLHFPLDVRLLDLEPSESATMLVHGEAPGIRVQARSSVALQEHGAGTRLHWNTRTTAHGMVATVAGAVLKRLVEARITEFWDAFARDAPARAATRGEI